MARIKKNTVKNLKALADFTADFNGATCIITGKNNSGKSSFLRSLPDRFRGIKPSIILKEGTDEGFQEMELDNNVKLRWEFDNKTKQGERLIYTYLDADGKEIRTTATADIMEKFFPGKFNIDVFLNSTPQKQRKMLSDLVGLDFTLIDNRHKLAYDERTLANNKLKEAKLGLSPVNEKLATELIDVLPIQQKLWAIDSHNEAFRKAEQGKANLEKQKTDNEGIIKSLQAQIKKLETDNKDIDKRLIDADKWLSKPENKQKDADYHTQVSNELWDAKIENERITKNNEALKKHQDLIELDQAAKQKDKAVKDIEAEKMEMIRKANLPEGFEFSDDGILFNGLPVSRQQLSSSAIYIVALKLALMEIGELRTLHFDASFLDKVSLAEIEDWAQKEDLQLLIEIPDREAGEIRYELLEVIK